jgi:hypothetical protein
LLLACLEVVGEQLSLILPKEATLLGATLTLICLMGFKMWLTDFNSE